MEWETLRAAVDLLLGSAESEVSLTFFGGEPLLEYPLIRRCVAYVNGRAPANQAVDLKLITNGTLLDDEVASFLDANRIRTRLSFDGVPEAQLLRGAATFEHLDSLIDDLHRNHHEFVRDRLCISVTLTARTIPNLGRSVDYLLSKDLHEIAIGVLVTRDPDWHPEHHQLLDEQFRRVYRSTLLHAARTGRVPVNLFRKPVPEKTDPTDCDQMCRVAKGDRLTVDADGQVYPCVTLAESYQALPETPLFKRMQSLRMGGILDSEFERRLAAYRQAAREPGVFHGRRRKYSSCGGCRKCRYFSNCTVCPVSIAHQPGNTDPDRIPDFVCSFNRIALKYRERFPTEPTADNLLAAAIRFPEVLRRGQRPASTRPNPLSG